MTDCDVLIIGAGPVGTALALELALHKVSFRIIDQVPVRSDKSRALVIQARTLELLNRHGAADSIVRRGRSLQGGAMYIEGDLAVEFDVEGLGNDVTDFPLPLNISQAMTEEFLDECLAKYGRSVERPVTATSIIQDASGVTTTLEMPEGGSQTVRSKYVVGCDGAHSIVRHTAKNIAFEGSAYRQDFMLCDVYLRDSNLPQDRISLHLGPKGVLALFPLTGGVIRLILCQQKPQTPAGADTPPDEPTLSQFQAALTKYTPPGSGTLHDPVWLTRFRLHHRCASSYRDGRLFVAGDAAHIHSPAGGQGMNAGIQDSINLGWKLARALSLQQQPSSSSSSSPDTTSTTSASAEKADALLDTYTTERRPVGLALLKGTDRMFTFVAGANPWLVPLRNLLVRYVMPWLLSSATRRRAAFMFLSQLGTTYRGSGSGMVGTAAGFKGPVKGGDRLVHGRVKRGDGTVVGLQRVCVGREWHLVVFAGEGGEGGGLVGAKGKEVEMVEERVSAALGGEVKVHYISPDGKSGEGVECYADPEGVVHAQFGFGLEKPGYVLVRPDGYVGHIGPLDKMNELVAFLEG